VSLRRTLAIARAEWLLNRRDPRSLGVIFALPVLLLILYGYGLNFDLHHLRVAVQDLDRSELSREIIQRAAASDYFDFVAQVRDSREISSLLRSRRALMVLVIPPGFAADVAARNQGRLQLVVDGSDAVTAGTAIGYAQGLVARLGREMARQWALESGLGGAPPAGEQLAAGAPATAGIDMRVEVLFNPGLSSAAFIIPGLIGVVMALMAALLTSTSIVREREVGTIEALLATPVRAAEIILGKLLPYAALGLVDIGLAVGAGALIFGVLPRGNALELVAVSAVFIIASLSIGLAVSGASSSQRTAIVGGLMSLMLPTILLSGFIFPIANFPAALRVVSYVLPATHYLVLMRAIYLRAVSLFLFWPYLLALGGETVIIFALAVKSFRARL
jgi:ABC-2 type transport system permease protein